MFVFARLLDIKNFTLQIYEIKDTIQGTAVSSQFSETHQPCFSYNHINCHIFWKWNFLCAHWSLLEEVFFHTLA